MVDYDRLQKDLNQYALYLLNSIKRDYGAFLSERNQQRINTMLQDDKLVEIAVLVGEDKVHVNPNHEIFKANDYNVIKNYFMNNCLVGELFRQFIPLAITDDDYISLEEPHETQSCCISLRKGFISDLSREFTKRNRLTVPEEYNEKNLEFVVSLQEAYPSFTSYKSYIFGDRYLPFANEFFEQTGENLLDIYKKYKISKMDSGIELLEIDDIIYDEEISHKSGR